MGTDAQVGIRIRADGKGAVGTFRLTREELDKLGDAANKTDSKARKGAAGLKELDKRAASLKGSLTALVAAGTAVAGIGAGLFVVANDFSQAVKEADNYSKALGVSVESLTAWQYAANDVGMQADKIADIFKDTAEKIGDAYANGGGEAVEALKALGLSVDQLVRMAPDQQLLAIATQLDNVGTQAEKIQILESLASDASLLLPLLDNDAARLKQLTAEAQAFGMVIDSEVVAQARQFDDQLRQLKASATGLQRELAIDLLPGLNEITRAMAEAAKEGGPLLALWVGMGGAVSQLVFGTEMQQAIDDVDDLEKKIKLLQGRLDRKAFGTGLLGKWLGEGIKEDIAEAEKELLAARQRLETMKSASVKPPAPLAAPAGLGAPPAGGTKSSVTDANAAIGVWVASLEQAREAIGRTDTDLAALNANYKINSEITKALADGNTAAAAAWEQRRSGIVALVVETEKEKQAEKELAAELDGAIAAQVAMEKAYDDRMTANKAVVDSLNQELAVVGMSNRELSIANALRRLSSDATAEQRKQVEGLAGELYDEAAAAKKMANAHQKAMDIIKSSTDRAMWSAEDAFTKFVKTGKLEIGDLVDTILDELIRLQFRQSVAPALNSAFGGIFSGSFGAGDFSSTPGIDLGSFGGSTPIQGSWFDDIFSVFGFHAGGVGQNERSFTRPLPASIFRDAPRFHTGIGPHEMPAVIRKDEGVFTPGQMRALAPVDQMGGGDVIVHIHEAPGTQTQVQQSRGQDGQMRLDVIIEQVDAALGRRISTGVGGLNRAMQNTYGLNPAAGAHR